MSKNNNADIDVLNQAVQILSCLCHHLSTAQVLYF